MIPYPKSSKFYKVCFTVAVIGAIVVGGWLIGGWFIG
jgi:hypothetical protein